MTNTTLVEMLPVSVAAASNSGEIRDDVREHYAARVRTASSCCGSGCGGDSAGWGTSLYTADELALVPTDSATVSYGCGNPTAIAALAPGEIVLDLGSGGGIDCFLAAQRVGPSGFAYGVDMTDEMLDLANRNATRQGIKNVEFRKGYIEAIPLPDATVDVIISNCVVNLSPDKPAALREAYRVLRPGGRVAISDVVIDGDLSDLPVSEAQVRAALSWAGCIAGALTVHEMENALAEAGFVEIAVTPRHHYALDELEQAGGDSAGIPSDVAARLAERFAGADIQALRPR